MLLAALALQIKNTDDDRYVHKVVSSHSNDTLSCLASHPTELVVASAGSDKTLRIWSVRRKVLVDLRVLPTAGTALCFSPKTGDSLCLGLSSGGIAIFDMYLNVELAFQHCSKPITCAKYSPNGQLLAVGSEDTNIYLYDPTKGYSRMGVCRGHYAAVSHIDFSVNSKYVQSNDASYDVCFWDQWGDAVSESLTGTSLPGGGGKISCAVR